MQIKNIFTKNIGLIYLIMLITNTILANSNINIINENINNILVVIYITVTVMASINIYRNPENNINRFLIVFIPIYCWFLADKFEFIAIINVIGIIPSIIPKWNDTFFAVIGKVLYVLITLGTVIVGAQIAPNEIAIKTIMSPDKQYRLVIYNGTDLKKRSYTDVKLERIYFKIFSLKQENVYDVQVPIYYAFENSERYAKLRTKYCNDYSKFIAAFIERKVKWINNRNVLIGNDKVSIDYFYKYW